MRKLRLRVGNDLPKGAWCADGWANKGLRFVKSFPLLSFSCLPRGTL